MRKTKQHPSNQLMFWYFAAMIVGGLLSAFFTGQAHAGTANLTWTNPTTNTDNSPIAAIVQTRLEYGTCSGANFGSKLGEWVNSGTGTASSSPNLAAGTYCFRAYTKTANGESGPSNVAQKVIVPPLPNPPTNLTVAADLTAYILAPTTNRIATLIVGTFTPGTACDPTQPVLDKFVVLVDAAHPVIKPPTSTNKSVVYLGSCS